MPALSFMNMHKYWRAYTRAPHHLPTYAEEAGARADSTPGIRKGSMPPNYWDEIPRLRVRSWKDFRKNQHR